MVDQIECNFLGCFFLIMGKFKGIGKGMDMSIPLIDLATHKKKLKPHKQVLFVF